ncbi:hypothetical protein ACWEQL_20260 [Kitasatospora sp. NPDC004240]
MTQPIPPVASPSSSWSVWVLTVWHPVLGLPVEPVAVLARDSSLDATPMQHLVWVPLVYDDAGPWRERLAEGVTDERIAVWEAESGTCHIARVPVPDEAVDLRHAAELVLDQLLAEVIPVLPTRAGA